MTNDEMSKANDPIVVWHEQAVSRGDRERSMAIGAVWFGSLV